MNRALMEWELWPRQLRVAMVALVAIVIGITPAAAQSDGPVPARAGETFGDWLFECTAIAEGQTACSLTQTIVVRETGRPITKFSLARGSEGNTGFMVVMLPLGIDIPAGVQGAIDSDAAIPFLVETCVASGCLATMQADASRLQQLKAGTAFNLSFRFRGESSPVTIAGSLNGITAGMAAAGIQ